MPTTTLIRALFTLLLLGLSTAVSAEPDEVAQEEIDYLLQFVEESPCTFIRNSERYEGPETADHLRMKFEHDRRHVDTAELFIDRVGTSSSVTDMPYTVNCGGKAEPSREWLHRALAEYRNQSDPYRDR